MRSNSKMEAEYPIELVRDRDVCGGRWKEEDGTVTIQIIQIIIRKKY
jgi:hypothetical protein